MKKNNKRAMSDKALFKKLWNYIRVYKYRYFFAILLTILIVAIDLLPALLEGQIIALLNYDGATESTDAIIKVYEIFINKGYAPKDAKLTIALSFVY